MAFSMELLHLQYIGGKLVLPSDLVRAREVVHLLILIEPFVDIRFSRGVHPENVPVVSLCMVEARNFKSRSNHLLLALQKLIK